MANPPSLQISSLAQASPFLTRPAAAPEVLDNVLPATDEHPRVAYLKKMVEKGQLLPDGRLVRHEKFFFSPQTLASARAFLDRNPFIWKLAMYFSKLVKGTVIEITEGAQWLVGKEGWEAVLRSKIEMESPALEMWDFCTKAPPVVVVHLTIPASSGLQRQDIELCQNLCLYFCVAEPQGGYIQAVTEFSTLNNWAQTIQPMPEPMQLIWEQFQQMKSKAVCSIHWPDKSNLQATVELPGFKVVFSFSPPAEPVFQCDHFKLRFWITSDTPILEPIFGGAFPTEALHDPLIHRLAPTLPNDPKIFSAFWAHITCRGGALISSETEERMERALQEKKGSLPVWISLMVMEGKRLLAGDPERLLAFQFNMIAYLADHQMPLEQVPVYKAPAEGLGPLGRFLDAHLDLLRSRYKEIAAVLTVMAWMQHYFRSTADAPQGRPTSCNSKPLIEFAAPEYYLVFADAGEQSFECLVRWLKEDHKAALACLSQALKLFFPDLDFLPKPNGKKRVLYPLAEPIYRQLEESGEADAAFVWYMGLCASGWKNLGADDLLALQSWRHLQAEVVLKSLDLVYQNTPYAALFGRIRGRWMGLKEATEDTVRLICLEEMILSNEEAAMRAAWAALLKTPAECFMMLRQVCNRLSARALPAALGVVCDLCSGVDLNREEQSELLAIYLEPLKSSLQNREVLPYVLKLAERVHQACEANDTAFLATRYSLLAVLAADPAVPHQAEIKAAVSPENLWEKIKKTAAEKESPEALLNLIQNFQRLLLSSTEKWDQFEEMAAIFTEILPRMKGQLPGIATVFEWIAGVLAAQKRHGKIYEIVGKMPAVKNDKLVPKWTEVCLSRFMEDAIPEQEMCLRAAQAREAGVYKHLPSSLLLKLLEYLLLISDSLNEKTRKEASFLIGCIEPSKEEAPRFALCLASYYRRSVDNKWLFQLVDGLGKYFSQLKGVAGFNIGETAQAAFKLLKQQSKEANLWQKFSLLFEKLVSDEGQTEAALGVIEELAVQEFLDKNSVREPCFAVFSKTLAVLEKKLTDPQKVRLAKAVAAFIDRAAKEKKEAEALANFPQTWVMALLQRAETAEVFARIFISSFKKNRPAMKAFVCDTVLWLVPFVLKQTETEPVKQLRTIAMDIPVKEQSPKAAEWRRTLAGIACRPEADRTALTVIARLIQMSEGAEKAFFEECRQQHGNREFAQLQSRLEDYFTTGAAPPKLPKKEALAKAAPAPAAKGSEKKPAAASQPPALALPPPAKEEKAKAKQEPLISAMKVIEFLESGGLKLTSVQELASLGAADSTPALPPNSPPEERGSDVHARIGGTLQSADDLETSLRLLEQHNVADFGLWTRLWGLVNIRSPHRERAWKAWLASHPIDQVRHEDGKHWHSAIYTCMTGNMEKEAFFDAFLTTQLIPLLDQLEGPEVRAICCLLAGIALNYCWNKRSGSDARLQALHDLTVNAALQAKIGESNPVAFLDREKQFRYALLLASAPVLSLAVKGENLLVDLFRPVAEENQNLTNEQNEVYFRNYCKRPYVPANPDSQELFYRWITFSMILIQGELGWDDAAQLFQALCRFNFTPREGENVNIPFDIVAKWERYIKRMSSAAEPPVAIVEHQSAGAILAHMLKERASSVGARSPTDNFYDATRAVIDRLMSANLPLTQRFASLRAFIENVSQLEKRFVQNHFLEGGVRLSARFVYHSFHEMDIGDMNSVFLIIDGLTRFKICITPLYMLWEINSRIPGNEEASAYCIETVTAFAEAIASIIRLGTMSEFRLIQTLFVVMDILMGMPHVINGDPHKYSWRAMLMNIVHGTEGMSKKEESNRKQTIQAIAGLFGRCTNPLCVSLKNRLLISEQTQLLQASSKILCSLLSLLELEYLTLTDWNDLFSGVSRGIAEEMINSLRKPKVMDDFFAIIRAIRFLPAFDISFLSFISDVLCEVISLIPPFQPGEDHFQLIQLQVRWYVVLTISSLAAKWQLPAYVRPKNQRLKNMLKERTRITREFIHLALPGIVDEPSYKVYSRYLIEVMNSADLAILTDIHEAFVIPNGHPLAEKLKAMKGIVTAKIEALKKPGIKK